MKVFISGNFNVIHPGHIRLFKKARQYADRLIVGVYSSTYASQLDLFSDEARVDALHRNNLIDEVLLISSSLKAVLDKVQPDFIIKGREFEERETEESQWANANGKRIIYSDGDPLFSELDILSLSNSPSSIQSRMNSTTEEFNIDISKIKKNLSYLEKLRVTVIGDLIIDEYINCEPIGLSREDANVVLRPIDSAIFFGGASIVARHCRGLGAQVKFVTVANKLGHNVTELSKTMELDGIELEIVDDFEREEIVKKRFRVDGVSRFRITEGSLEPIHTSIERAIIEKCRSLIADSDLIVFSDFNYGAIPEQLPKLMTENREKNCLIAADSQISSQIGSLLKYRNVDLISATEYEARVSLNNQDLGLAKLITSLRKQLQSTNAIIKMGRDGLIYETESELQVTRTGAFKSFNPYPRDVAGAGDSLLATSALLLTSGLSLHEAAFAGSLAAALQVEKIGNLPLTKEDLIAYLSS